MSVLVWLLYFIVLGFEWLIIKVDYLFIIFGGVCLLLWVLS